MLFPETPEAEMFAKVENFNDWVCPICFKKISASRPPIFNADNCSCDDIAAYHSATHNYFPESATYEHQLYNPDIVSPIYSQAQSINSSTDSVPCPEGPEHKTPDLEISNTYLPLTASPGLNETQHQRASSFHSDMSYPLRRFLDDMHSHAATQPAVYGTELAVACTSTSASNLNFLSQEIHLQSSKKVKRGSPYSKHSWASESCGNGDANLSTLGSDALIGTGFWVGNGGYATAGYAMVLSGITDSAVFDDEASIPGARFVVLLGGYLYVLVCKIAVVAEK
ncbi:uncharacterized protein RSE6_08811 [Rhynchosporium secalis]|uniref:Uncharacterized protein n=1 Tax=Rhynchosporium secalis TaxID=38038 RepID=A0A1E1MGC2_RHYSE|nr:uncharacterized protein RSE6_08811 [Rhynchosporium secalis]